jgi:hypothetical protein
MPDHPRILFFKGEEDKILKKLQSDAGWGKVHDMIIGECNDIVGKPPLARVLIGRRLLDKSREALKRIFYLSYAYRMTGNKIYLDRAEKELLAVSDFSDWNPSLSSIGRDDYGCINRVRLALSFTFRNNKGNVKGSYYTERIESLARFEIQ